LAPSTGRPVRARTGRGGLLRPLGERDFRLLWAGQAVSLLGDGILTVALAWQTLQLSPSPTALALVMFARAAPRILLMLLGGVISDRLPRRLVMLAADLVQAAAVGVLALLAAGDQLRLWHLVAVAAVASAASAFFLPASTALLPDLLATDLLLPANALGTSSRVLATQFAGPALGGLLVATVGTAAAFAVDAASFLVSVATLAMLRTRPLPPPASERAGMVQEVREGLAYARGQPWIWVTLVVAAVGNFLVTGPLQVLLPVLVRQLGAGAGSLGLVYAAFGVGGGLAVLLAGHFGLPRWRVTAMYAAWIPSGLVVAGIGAADGVAALAVLYGLAGLLLELGNLIWSTLLQERVPARVLGRVSSLDWLISVGTQPIAIAATGPLAAAVGATTVLVVGGLVSVPTSVAGLLWPGVRDPDREAADQAARGVG
jgi:Transmembrane secretion effector